MIQNNKANKVVFFTLRILNKVLPYFPQHWNNFIKLVNFLSSGFIHGLHVKNNSTSIQYKLHLWVYHLAGKCNGLKACITPSAVEAIRWSHPLTIRDKRNSFHCLGCTIKQHAFLFVNGQRTCSSILHGFKLTT